MCRHIGDTCKPLDAGRTRPARTLVTIAGSAGGFYPLYDLVGNLPPTLRSALAVMLHLGPRSALTETLAQRSQLAVREAVSGDVLCDGCIYVPRPGTHLIVNPDGRLSVSRAAPVNRYRPCADWLFESAAASFRERHIAVVLSGMLSDGARQIRSVKRLGGTVFVQSPLEAEYPDMPTAAIRTGCVDKIVPADQLVPVICQAVDRCNEAAPAEGW